MSTDSTLIASTPKSQSIASSNCHVEVTTSTQFQHQPITTTNPFHHAMKANGDISSAAANTIDYDFNINAIKTLLMTSKVPESCV
jgi:hypothetical protein